MTEYLRSAMNSRKIKRTNRSCLRCRRVFKSEGKWNRMCPRCKGKDTPFYDHDFTGLKYVGGEK